MSHAAKLLQTATTHHQAGQLADAEKAYRKLLRVEAAHIDGLRLLGGLYMQTGQLDKAVECLEKAARLHPQNVETLTNLKKIIIIFDKLEIRYFRQSFDNIIKRNSISEFIKRAYE